jgi:hypothetical protein
MDGYSENVAPVNQQGVRMLVGSELTFRSWMARWGTRLIYAVAYGVGTPVVIWLGVQIAEAIR